MATTIRPDATIQARQTCSECDGKGYTAPRNYCQRCGQSHGPAALEAAARTDEQPCGHPWSSFHEEDWCVECEGSGTVVLVVSMGELAEALAPLIAQTVSNMTVR